MSSDDKTSYFLFNRIIFGFLILVNIGCIIAQPIENLRAIHMGGNWGLNVTGMLTHPPEYFAFLQNLNAKWVGISIALHIDDSMDSTVERKYSNVQIPTFTDSVLSSIIHVLKHNSFNVMLTLAFETQEAEQAQHPVARWQLGDPRMPEEDPNILSEFWPWSLNHPEHSVFVNKFWETYIEQVVHFAEIAENEGVDIYSLGTETDRLIRSRQGGYWPNHFYDEIVNMVDSARSRFSGLLTYDMHYGVLTANDFYGPGSNHLWEDGGFDIVGISAYFPLVASLPTIVLSVDTLMNSWEQIFNEHLIPLKKNNPNLPMLLLEFGYVNAIESPYQPSYSEFEPWIFEDNNGNGLDDSEETQANIYESFFNIKDQNPGILEGAFMWGHDLSNDNDWANVWGGVHHFGVRQKLAEEVLRTYYGNLLNIISIDNHIPNKFELFHIFPNPFNPITNISYFLPKMSNVRLTIYDMIGREISTLYNGTQIPGYHTINWNASEQSSGIYFVKIIAGKFVYTHKLMLVK